MKFCQTTRDHWIVFSLPLLSNFCPLQTRILLYNGKCIQTSKSYKIFSLTNYSDKILILELDQIQTSKFINFSHPPLTVVIRF